MTDVCVVVLLWIYPRVLERVGLGLCGAELNASRIKCSRT
jgi:hypothetical protein